LIATMASENPHWGPEPRRAARTRQGRQRPLHPPAIGAADLPDRPARAGAPSSPTRSGHLGSQSGSESCGACARSAWITSLPLSQGHVRSVLAEFVSYYNQERPHRSLGWRLRCHPVAQSTERWFLGSSWAVSITSRSEPPDPDSTFAALPPVVRYHDVGPLLAASR